MNVYDIINRPENMEGMRKLLSGMGGKVSDNDVRTALLVLADSVNEYEHDEHEMKVRFEKYKENPKSSFALHVLVSGLSSITLCYAVKYKKDGLNILIRRTGEKKQDALIVYSSPDAMNVPSLDDAAFYETDLDEVVEICEENSLRFIIFNPETDNVRMSVSSVEEFIETFNDTDEQIKTALEAGVLGRDLFPELMEALVHEHIKVLMNDNSEFAGDVMPWRRDRPVMDQMMTVRTADGAEVSVCIPDIKHICLFMDDLPLMDDFPGGRAQS